MSAVDAIMPEWEPITVEIDLPPPVSTNRLWRSGRGRVFKSAQYKQWLIAADQLVMVGKILRGHRTIDGPFEAHILLNSELVRGDADNRIKGILDYAQSRKIISNDKFARRVTIEWVTASKAPAGCKLIIRELA